MSAMPPPIVTKPGVSFVTIAAPKCAQCKHVMALRPCPGQPKRFCSTACRMKAHRKAKALMRPNEFYTPSHIIEIARACMGGIDLDPASCAVANETVKATTFFDIKQNGLKRPWFGRVWLNPPYGRFSPPFVRKAVTEFKASRVEKAIFLLKADHMTTGWFNDAMHAEYIICLPRNRINFSSPNYDSSTSAMSGSVIIGIGVDRERFKEFFGPLGKIAFAPIGGAL
jgi:ParB family chromosome partitioning protein